MNYSHVQYESNELMWTNLIAIRGGWVKSSEVRGMMRVAKRWGSRALVWEKAGREADKGGWLEISWLNWDGQKVVRGREDCTAFIKMFLILLDLLLFLLKNYSEWVTFILLRILSWKNWMIFFETCKGSKRIKLCCIASFKTQYWLWKLWRTPNIPILVRLICFNWDNELSKINSK